MIRAAAHSTRGAARFTRNISDNADLPGPAWPLNPPRAGVADLNQSLEFYLRLGCEVRSAADGWVLLGFGPTTFVLIPNTVASPDPQARRAPRPAPPPGTTDQWIRLTTPDVRALRWRLLTEGVPVGPVITTHITTATATATAHDRRDRGERPGPAPRRPRRTRTGSLRPAHHQPAPSRIEIGQRPPRVDQQTPSLPGDMNYGAVRFS